MFPWPTVLPSYSAGLLCRSWSPKADSSVRAPLYAPPPITSDGEWICSRSWRDGCVWIVARQGGRMVSHCVTGLTVPESPVGSLAGPPRPQNSSPWLCWWGAKGFPPANKSVNRRPPPLACLLWAGPVSHTTIVGQSHAHRPCAGHGSDGAEASVSLLAPAPPLAGWVRCRPCFVRVWKEWVAVRSGGEVNGSSQVLFSVLIGEVLFESHGDYRRL